MKPVDMLHVSMTEVEKKPCKEVIGAEGCVYADLSSINQFAHLSDGQGTVPVCVTKS